MGFPAQTRLLSDDMQKAADLMRRIDCAAFLLPYFKTTFGVVSSCKKSISELSFSNGEFFEKAAIRFPNGFRQRVFLTQERNLFLSA